MNNKFFTSKEIYAKIVSSYRSKSNEISILHVMRWCSELVTEILRDPAGLIKNNKQELIVVSNRCEVPDNIFQLEAVFNESNALVKDYLYQGQYLFFSDKNKPTKVYIDYYSIAVDEDGFPLLKRGYEQAAYAYCVYKMFEEDASTIPPRIAQWRWYQIEQNKDWEIEAANRSWEDVDDNTLMRIHSYIVDPVYAARINPQLLEDKNYLGQTANRSK